MTRKTCILLLLSLLAFTAPLTAATTSTTPAADMTKIFPIGVWFDGRVEGINCPPGYHNVPRDMEAARAYYLRNFQDIHDHAIDIVVIPNTPPDYRETLLTAADEVGLKVVLELVELAYVDFGGRHSVRHPDMIKDEAEMVKYVDDVTSSIRKHDSLMCYQILDEPPAELFENFALAKRVLEQVDPAHPSFSCLCNEGELPRTTTMGTQMIIFDRYPLRKPSKPGEYDFSEFAKLLDTLDREARELPYWMVVQACAMDKPEGLRYPTEAELRLMTWLSVAHNAKGIFFFLHNSYTQEEKLQGLVDLDMTPHPIYAEAAQLARNLKRLAPLLLQLDRSKTPFVKPQDGFDVQSFSRTGNSAKGKGNQFAFVVNLDVLRSGTFESELAVAPPDELRDLVTDTLVEVKREGETARFTLRLPPGGAALLRVGTK